MDIYSLMMSDVLYVSVCSIDLWCVLTKCGSLVHQSARLVLSQSKDLTKTASRAPPKLTF